MINNVYFGFTWFIILQTNAIILQTPLKNGHRKDTILLNLSQPSCQNPVPELYILPPDNTELKEC